MFERPPRATHHCRHYSYRMGGLDDPDRGPACGIGIDLSAPGASRPCWGLQHEIGETPCPRREEYTEAERGAWEAWTNERLARLARAIGAVPHPIPLRSGGVVACPSCGGNLRYDRWERGASVVCSTPDCCGAQFNIASGVDWPSAAPEADHA